jgi:hypothetical protein
MRREVRLLGDILGEIIRDSGGPELLADVEGLRHAVIDARQHEPHDGHAAADEIATLVASWSVEQAEQVARAFAVYFHLANLAEEHQRIRNLRERDTGQEPVRESLAAAVAEISRDAGPEHLRELLASLRVHLVLTAHPTEARRRAVVAALRRISGLLDVLDDQRAAAADHAAARRELREQIDLLWRTSQLRVKAMDPIDEVRTVMTAFDETLFRVVPAVYRELDRAVAVKGAGPGGTGGGSPPCTGEVGGSPSCAEKVGGGSGRTGGDLLQVVADHLEVVPVLDHGAERVLRVTGVQVCLAEEVESPGPVDGFRHPRRLGQVELAKPLDGSDDLAGQRRGDAGFPDQDDLDLAFGGRVADPVVEATPLQRVVQLPGPVGGEHHDRRALRLDRADLGDADLEVGEHLEQESLELVVGPVDLVDQQHGLIAGPDRLQQRPFQQELRTEQLVHRVGARHLVLGQGPDVQHLPGVIPLVQRLVGVDALIALKPDQFAAEH